MAWNVTNVSLRQSILPQQLMGRVHATHRFIANGAGLLGAVTAGAVGEAFGLQAAFAIGAAIVLLGVLGRFVITDDRIRAAESAADAPKARPEISSRSRRRRCCCCTRPGARTAGATRDAAAADA